MASAGRCPSSRPRARCAATVAAAAAVLALAGCGGEDGPATTQPSSGAVTPGGGLSVAEAVATDAEPPLAVAGWVVDSGEGARLCSGYRAEADEPCVEPSLALMGAGTEESGKRVTLVGAVEDATFVVSPTVQG